MPPVAEAARPEPAATPAPEQPERKPRPARSAALQEAIDALPVVARIEGLAPTPFVLRGDLSPKRAREMERVARAVIEDVARRFVGNEPNDALTPVDVCLFETEESYAAFAAATGDRDTMMGYYLPRQRLIAANLRRSVGNLRHELVHPLIGDDFAELPEWVNEGMGSLYGTARVTKRGVAFLVNYRLRHVRRALRRGELPTLDDMALSSRAEIYGRDSMTYYGTARYLLLYLDAAGELEEFYRELRAERPTMKRQLELLEQSVDYDEFLRWTKRLRIGRRPVKI
jgi:hypothetical protein